MTTEEDLATLAGWMEALQEPAFRRFFQRVWGSEITVPGGCLAQLQEDGALLCIACRREMPGEEEIDWLPR